MVMLCVLSNQLIVSRKIWDRSPDNNLSAKTKWQNGVTQGAVFFHLVSSRKSASIVKIVFIKMKWNLDLSVK